MERSVFYIAGFDPRSYKYYYSMFKNNVFKTGRLDAKSITITKLTNAKIPYFDIDYEGFKTRYYFLAWNDIVVKHFSKTFFAVILSAFIFLKAYIFTNFFSNVVFKVAKESRTQLIAGLYPVLFLLLSYTLVFFLLYLLFLVMHNHLIVFVLITGVILFLASKLVLFVGDKGGIFWLLSIYAFCYQYARGAVCGVEDRNTQFALAIVENLKQNANANHETLVVAHSVGTILAVSVMAKVIEICKRENIHFNHLKLVLIGECIPLTSYHKCAMNFKAELDILAKTKFIWLDFTSKIDGACFFMLDYLKTSGVFAKAGCGPKMLSVRFFKIYTKKTYKRIRYKWYQVHFLYLKATELNGGYDYFYMVCGAKKLEEKVF